MTVYTIGKYWSCLPCYKMNYDPVFSDGGIVLQTSNSTVVINFHHDKIMWLQLIWEPVIKNYNGKCYNYRVRDLSWKS